MERLKPYEKVAGKKEEYSRVESFHGRKPIASSTPLKKVGVVTDELVVHCYCGKGESLNDPTYIFCDSCKM